MRRILKEDYVQHSHEELSTAIKGAINELAACRWFLSQGYEVFRNVSPIGKADIVIWKKGEEPILIDVKSRVDYTTVKGDIIEKCCKSKIKGVKYGFMKKDGNFKFSE